MKNFLKNTASTSIGVFLGLTLVWLTLEMYYSHSMDPKVMGNPPAPKN